MPAGAQAASPYYAAPTAIGLMNCSSPANACDVYTARTMANMAGDQVLLADGTYSLQTGGSIAFTNPGITVQPQTAGTRPLFTSTNGNDVGISAAGTTIQDVDIDVSGLGSGGRALDFQDAGTALRVRVTAAGAMNPIGVQLREGALLSDSAVVTQSPGGNDVAVIAGGTGGVVRNVTAYATGANSIGVNANGNFTAPGTDQVLGVFNTITRGTATDLAATGPGADLVNINVDHSNFVTTAPAPTAPPPPMTGAVITDLGSNQSQAPLLANPTGGNVTQLPGSPTIDAGSAAPGGPGLGGGLGPFDLDGEPRVMGLSVDIGADEFFAPGPAQFPNGTTPTTSTSKCKKGYKLKTVKTKKGKKKKKCVKKKKKKK